MLDVVIPVFNDLPGLSACLAGFESQTNYHFNLHVVCDGGDEAAAKEVAQSAGATFSYLGPAKTPEDPGRMAAVRNVGLKLCTAPRVLFVDGDCIPSEKVVETHSKGAGILTGRRLDLAMDKADRVRAGGQPNVGEMTEDIRLIWQGQPGEFAHIYLEGLTKPLGVETELIAWTCHVSYPTAIVRQLGGFWEKLVGWGGEDNELANRVIRAGEKGHTTMVPVYHLCHPKQKPAEGFNNLRDQSRANPDLVRNGGPI